MKTSKALAGSKLMQKLEQQILVAEDNADAKTLDALYAAYLEATIEYIKETG